MTLSENRNYPRMCLLNENMNVISLFPKQFLLKKDLCHFGQTTIHYENIFERLVVAFHNDFPSLHLEIITFFAFPKIEK